MCRDSILRSPYTETRSSGHRVQRLDPKVTVCRDSILRSPCTETRSSGHRAETRSSGHRVWRLDPQVTVCRDSILRSPSVDTRSSGHRVQGLDPQVTVCRDSILRSPCAETRSSDHLQTSSVQSGMIAYTAALHRYKPNMNIKTTTTLLDICLKWCFNFSFHFEGMLLAVRGCTSMFRGCSHTLKTPNFPPQTRDLRLSCACCSPQSGFGVRITGLSSAGNAQGTRNFPSQ